MSRFYRREVLRGLGVAIALPAFESQCMAQPKMRGAAKRFVCVSPSYGMNPAGFFPEQTGADEVPPHLLVYARVGRAVRLPAVLVVELARPPDVVHVHLARAHLQPRAPCWVRM